MTPEAPRALSAEPLTEAAVDLLRNRTRESGPRLPSSYERTIDRLLATLDAARAAITPEAGLDVEALAVALHASRKYQGHLLGGACDVCRRDAFLIGNEYRPRAALRVTPVEGEAGPDDPAKLRIAKALFKEVALCTGCDFDHGWDDHVLSVWRAALSPEDPRRSEKPIE